ncbi:MAG: hypothetical protein GXY41_11075 [Phycisphaerae bacterium]|nr:hypothetical protein [Phycisphaerae bacterium]
MAVGVLDRLGDMANPIAVKEMRQAVKGRILTWMLVCFLMVQLVIMGIGMLTSEYSGADYQGGRTLLSFLLLALLVVCLLFLPAIFGLRLSSERTEGRIDLLFITDMSPYSVIWGKTLAAMGLTLLLFSASMPFVTLTYLLRGVDLPSIFLMMGLNFVVVVLAIQAALFLACFPGGLISRGIRFLFGLGGAFFLLSMMTSVSFAMLSSGIGSMLGTWDFWAPALTVIGFLLLGMGLLFVLSATAISPASANRAPVVRLYLLLIWLCSSVCCLLWFLDMRDYGLLLAWLICMLILFSLCFMASLAERQSYGVRLRSKIPRNRLLRIPAFFLYSGAAGGISFSAGMIALTLGAFYLALFFSPYPRWAFNDDVHLQVLTCCLYFICYGLTALMVRRLFFPPLSSNSMTVTIALLLLAAGSLIPFLFAWVVFRYPVDRIPDIWYLGNPLIVFIEKRTLEMTLTFTQIWAAVILGLNGPWFIRQIRNFKPLEEAAHDPAISQPVETE